MDRPASWRVQRIDLSAEPRLDVGGATIDPVSREVRFAGGTERLQPQNLKVLIALARRRGEVVTRAELIDQCWDGRIVGEDVINHAISVLRTFAAKAGVFEIETVPKAGYRLIETAATEAPKRRFAAWMGWALAAAVPAALLLALPGNKPGEPPLPSVALRPFASPPGDAAAAEVARATRTALSHMLTESGLPVRFADTGDAGADFIISGDILRGASALEANVRLEETRRDTVIFSHRYEAVGADPDSLPDQVGASVAANLSWGAALMILDRRDPTDPAIMTELLKQLTITVEGGDMLRSYAISREIARKAPNSAIAQIALAFNAGLALGQLPRSERDGAVALGRAASVKARTMAPEFGDVYIPWCLMHGPTEMVRCEGELRAGMRADPDAPFVTSFLAALMSNTGRFREGLELARMSFAGNQYMLAKNAHLITALLVTGQEREARDTDAQALRWWPTNQRVIGGPVLGFILAGDLAAIGMRAPLEPSIRSFAASLATAVRARDTARTSRLCAERKSPRIGAMLCLVSISQSGQVEAAFAQADRMYPRKTGRDASEEERLWLDDPYGYPLALLSAPSTAALRRDPRFVSLAERVGLLKYWRSNRLPDFCRPPAEPVCARLRHAGSVASRTEPTAKPT